MKTCTARLAQTHTQHPRSTHIASPTITHAHTVTTPCWHTHRPLDPCRHTLTHHALKTILQSIYTYLLLCYVTVLLPSVYQWCCCWYVFPILKLSSPSSSIQLINLLHSAYSWQLFITSCSYVSVDNCPNLAGSPKVKRDFTTLTHTFTHSPCICNNSINLILPRSVMLNA